MKKSKEAEEKLVLDEKVVKLRMIGLQPFIGGKSGLESLEAQEILMMMIQDRILKSMVGKDAALEKIDPENEFVKNSSILHYYNENGDKKICLENNMIKASIMVQAMRLGLTSKATKEIPGRSKLETIEINPPIIKLYRNGNQITTYDRWSVERFKSSNGNSIVRYAQMVELPWEAEIEMTYQAVIKDEIIEKLIMMGGNVGAARKKYGKYVFQKIC